MPQATLQGLTARLIAFRAERAWEQFHNPKDQALSLCLESAEVLELMQWRNGTELEAHLLAKREALGQELSDVLGWVLLIAHDHQIDLADAFERKVKLNEQKYPIDKAFGKADKYTELP